VTGQRFAVGALRVVPPWQGIARRVAPLSVRFRTRGPSSPHRTPTDASSREDCPACGRRASS
jgi:hypothetical protein